jgi:hypothetical protein
MIPPVSALASQIFGEPEPVGQSCPPIDKRGIHALASQIFGAENAAAAAENSGPRERSLSGGEGGSEGFFGGGAFGGKNGKPVAGQRQSLAERLKTRHAGAGGNTNASLKGRKGEGKKGNNSKNNFNSIGSDPMGSQVPNTNGNSNKDGFFASDNNGNVNDNNNNALNGDSSTFDPSKLKHATMETAYQKEKQRRMEIERQKREIRILRHKVCEMIIDQKIQK